MSKQAPGTAKAFVQTYSEYGNNTYFVQVVERDGTSRQVRDLVGSHAEASELAAIIEASFPKGGDACTLDGSPAIISGNRERFALVRRLDGNGEASFSWSAVTRIMARDGAFSR